MKKLIFCYLFLLFSAFTCQKESEVIPTDIIIKSGTSFGMCVGHCITDAEINSQQIRLVRKAWRSQIADKTCQRAITSQEWESLGSLLDFDTFEQLPETTGCPDCADGGAEWIEITYGEQVKKVTFEFGKNIPEIAELTEKVRKIRDSLNNCN
jgi:hypothetical protein